MVEGVTEVDATEYYHGLAAEDHPAWATDTGLAESRYLKRENPHMGASRQQTFSRLQEVV